MESEWLTRSQHDTRITCVGAAGYSRYDNRSVLELVLFTLEGERCLGTKLERVYSVAFESYLKFANHELNQKLLFKILGGLWLRYTVEKYSSGVDHPELIFEDFK